MGAWTSFELSILDAIQNLSSPGMDKFMVTISSLGNASIIWIYLIVVFLSTREYKMMAKIMIVAFLANLLIVNLGLKNIFGRTRPYEFLPGFDLLIPSLSDGSFPSGHSSYAASFATIILVIGKSKLIKIFTSLLAILMAFSRLYLYVHFPTDVIAGLIIGFLIATYTMKIYYSDEFNELRSRFNLQRK